MVHHFCVFRFSGMVKTAKSVQMLCNIFAKFLAVGVAQRDIYDIRDW